MDVGAAFVTDAQAAVLVKPGERALDDPALLPEPGAVFALWPGDLRLDVPLAQLPASLPRVVGAIAVQLARATPRTATVAARRRDRIDEAGSSG